MFTEGTKVEINGNVFEVTEVTNSIVHLRFYSRDRRVLG
jgi:hypothetical protein